MDVAIKVEIVKTILQGDINLILKAGGVETRLVETDDHETRL